MGVVTTAIGACVASARNIQQYCLHACIQALEMLSVDLNTGSEPGDSYLNAMDTVLINVLEKASKKSTHERNHVTNYL